VRTLAAAIVALTATTLLGQADPTSRSWNQPVEPFRIISNIYYVGASDITSYLIATPKGHIVIDGGFPETEPMILRNVEKLGFDPHDIRIILNSHAHYDHAGGIAALREYTGATFIASEADAPLLARGGRDDPQFGERFHYPPVEPDQLLRDADRVSLGGSILTAHVTSGHTKGCTTFTMKAREKGKIYDVIFVCSTSAPDYRLVGNARYPDVVEDYRRTFAALRALPVDVFLGAHGSMYGLAGKMARRGKGQNPFVDPQGYKRYLDTSERSFNEMFAQQSKPKP